jgi:predicted Zn finger-like uncharacterized protein
MSLITCCPSCGTMFRVVPDQLRISEGWVRCGHCAEVFDATAHMMDEAPGEALEAPVTQPAPLEPFTALPSAAERAAAARPTPAAGRPAAQPASAVVFRRSDLGELENTPVAPPAAAPAAPASPAPAARPKRDKASAARDEPEANLEDLTFIRQARRQAFWGRPAVQGLLIVALLLLGALLALQIGLHDRDRLAAAEPSLRPWLQRLCEPLGCRIGPPRQIESITIEGSSFNRLRGDAYRLSFTLRNQAPVEVAVPAIELTLTDTQDMPVVRRVLTPEELGATLPVLGAAAEWTGSVSMAVTAGAGAGRIAGYRLLAFYP